MFGIVSDISSSHSREKGESSSLLFIYSLPFCFVTSFIFCVLFFKNTKNLFFHIARIPIGDSPRDIPTF